MTASRTCRACGAELSPDVLWCLRCYEPVRQLTPREPQLPTIHFLHPEDEPPRSRWKAGATTFGPVGRLAITALVLLLAPWSLNVVTVLVLWPVYLVLAALVLRGTWRKDYVDTTTVRELAAAGATSPPSPPPAKRPIPTSTIVVWALLVAAAVGVLVASQVVGDRTRLFIDVAVLLGGGFLMLRSLVRP